MIITIQLTKGRTPKWSAKGDMMEISQTMIDNLNDTHYDISDWMEFKLRERTILEQLLQDSKPIPTNK